MLENQSLSFKGVQSAKPPGTARSTAPTLSILICDDHDIFRLGLKQLLTMCLGSVHVGEAKNPRELMAQAETRKWNLVLLDITMPESDGLEALRELKIAHPDFPVLMLSGHPEEEFAVRSLKYGASGYINKVNVADEVVTAIRKVLKGDRYINSAIAEKLVMTVTHQGSRPVHETLSEREFQVLRLIASGKPIKEIAGSLSLSNKTVSTYRARISAKTGLTSNVAIARYAFENHLVG